MTTPPPPAASADIEMEVIARAVAHLPVVRAIMDRIGILDTLDELLGSDPRNRVSDAEAVLVMVLNILQGRVALYDMDEWLSGTDVELLLGAGVQASYFNDARLAACLDHIYEAGTENILSAVAKNYLGRPETPEVHTVHLDTTSIALQGAYESAEGRVIPARGYSKDNRPDLPQLVFGLGLHGSTGIPLAATLFSGNASDPMVNRFHLETLVELLPDPADVTLIGDCKLVDARTIGQLLGQKFHFVSLLPRNYGLREELVERVRVEGQALPELARSPGRTKKDPPRVYGGKSFVSDFTVGVGTAGDNHERRVPLRFLVVESNQLDEEGEGVVERRLERERASFEKDLAAARKQAWSCQEDAASALQKLTRKLGLHEAHVEVVATTVPVKRPTRGRPKVGSVPPEATVFKLVEKQPLTPLTAEVEKLRFHARHFVLITDHTDEVAWPDSRVLAEYRHQHIIEGHTGFRWLKNIATVAPVFLHTPTRIAALSLVMMLALMVRNYIQFELRKQLAETGATIPDRLKKPTAKPTTEVAWLPFAHVMVLRVVAGGRTLPRKLQDMNEHGRTVLRMLALDEAIFRTPPIRKFRSATPETSGM